MDWVRDRFLPRISNLARELAEDKQRRVLLEVGATAEPSPPGGTAALPPAPAIPTPGQRPEPPLHLRELRRGQVQPVRRGGGPPDRREPRQGL